VTAAPFRRSSSVNTCAECPFFRRCMSLTFGGRWWSGALETL
jgi:hypothetical protein